MRNSELRRALLAGAVVLALGWAGRAGASGFQLVEQNASGLGNAYAGQAAAAEDASTVFWNPAGMAFLPGRQVAAGVSLVNVNDEFEDRGTTPATGQVTVGGDGGGGGGLGVIPNGYVSVEAWRNLVWAGLGVSVPFGLKTEWDDGWAGRFHALKSEVKTININPAVAVKLGKWASVAAGVNYQWLDAELSNAVNYSAVVLGGVQAGLIPPAAVPGFIASCPGTSGTPPTVGFGCEGKGTVSGDAWSWGWNVGAMVDLPTKTRVGASYRSKIKHEVEGKVTFANRPALLATILPDGDIKTDIELPDTFSIAVAQQVLPRLQLLADFTWTGWSSLKDLDIFRTSGAPLTSTPLEFDDSWRIGLGANYQLSDPFKWRFGLAYDTTPVQDEFRTPRLPDQDRFWAATGLQWAFSKRAAIDAGFAYLFIKQNAPSDLPDLDPSPPAGFTATPKGALRGSYDASVWIASAQARFAF